MKRIAILLLVSKICICQTDTLNKYIGRHNKIGFWKIYLTKTLKVTKDTSEAYYYAYRYYDNGFYYLNPAIIAKGQKKYKMVYEGLASQKGHPILLNGNFRYYFKEKLKLEHIFKAGLPVKYMSYVLNTEGKLFPFEIVDYNNRYKGQIGSHLYELYYTDGKICQRYWYGKGVDGKWREYKENK